MNDQRFGFGLIAAALLVFVLPAPAQTQPPCFGHTHSIAWPPPPMPAPGTITRTVHGDFDGDHRMDAVARSGSELEFLYAPETWAIVHPFATQANDMDRADGLGPNGADALAVVGPQGLLVYTYDSAAKTLLPGAIVADTIWTHARLVRCGDLDGAGGISFVGLAADGITVIVRRWVAGSYVQTSFTVSSEVRDIVLHNTDIDLPLEINLLTLAGLELRDYDSAVLKSFAGSGVFGDSIAPVHNEVQGKGWIAWVRKTAAGNFGLQLASKRGIQLQFLLPASVSAPYAVVSGDTSYFFPSDGDDDLLIVHAGDPLPFYCENLGDEGPVDAPGPFFTAARSQPMCWTFDLGVFEWELNPPPSQSRPVFADFTGDGRLDVLHWVPSFSQFMFFEGTAHHRRLLGDDLLMKTRFAVSATTVKDELIFKLTYNALPHPQPGVTNVWLEYRIWKQEHTSAPLVGIGDYLLAVPPVGSPLIKTELDPETNLYKDYVYARVNLLSTGNDAGMSHTIPQTSALPEVLAGFNGVFWFEMRWETEWIGSNPPVVMPGQNYAGFFAAKSNIVASLWQPCYTHFPEFSGLLPWDSDPNSTLYSTVACQQGSTPPPAPRPAFGTRRRIVPNGNSGTTLPSVPPPVQDDYHVGWITSVTF